MAAPGTEAHVVVVWEHALHAAGRILADARSRFSVRDVVRVTWSPERFRRNLSRLYGTDLPADSHKERESGTGPFLAIVVDAGARTVARRHKGGWVAANAELLAAKRRYRRWAGGSYRVHATLSPWEAGKDAVLVLGEPLERLRASGWDGTVRARDRDLLGDPEWTSPDELRAALAAATRCTFPPTAAGGPLEVLTDDAWWAIRIADPPAAEGALDSDVRLRRALVAGRELAVLVRQVDDADVDPALAGSLPPAPVADVRPTLVDRLAAAARLRV